MVAEDWDSGEGAGEQLTLGDLGLSLGKCIDPPPVLVFGVRVANCSRL